MDWVEVIWESIRVFLTMGNLLGIVAIIIAVRTLNFSKRSFIVKDSYDPLLRILKENKEIGIYDTIQYKIDLLLELKETYIYSAFEKKEKLLINEIIKNATSINQYKSNAEFEARKAAEHVLLEELPKWVKDNRDLIDVELKGSEKLYSKIIDGTLGVAYIMREMEITCWLGELLRGIRYEEVGEEEFYEKSQGLPITYYLEETFDRSSLPAEIRNFEPTLFFLESVETKIKERFKKNVQFYMIQNTSNNLMRELDNLIYILNERVKRLLIPNYTFKKIANNLLFWKKTKN